MLFTYERRQCCLQIQHAIGRNAIENHIGFYKQFLPCRMRQWSQRERTTKSGVCFTLKVIARDGDSCGSTEVDARASRPLDIIAHDADALSPSDKDSIPVALEVAIQYLL